MSFTTTIRERVLRPLEALLERVPTSKIDMAIAIMVTVLGLTVFALVTTGLNEKAAFSFIQNIEQRSLDARFRLRGKRAVDPRVVIIGLDEKTLQKVGAWPIPRNAYAKLIDQLHAGGARLVAFDITFPNPEKNSAIEALRKLEGEVGGIVSPAVLAKIREIERTSDNDVLFAESMKRANNVLLGHVFLDKERAKALDPKASEDYFNVLWDKPFPQMIKTSDRQFDLGKAWCGVEDPKSGDCSNGKVMYGIESNISLLAEAARSYGFFNYNPDPDGTFRRAPLLLRYQDREWFPALTLQVLREYEDIKDENVAGYMAPSGLERIEVGPYNLRTESDGRLLINYAGPYHSYPHYSMADVIDGTIPPAQFKDKIVLVGATALGIGDMRVTPFQSDDYYMGVEIHANVVDNLLHNAERGRGFLSRGFKEEMIDIFFLLAFGAGMGVVFAKTKPAIATLSALSAFVLFAVVTYLAFSRFGMWLSFVIPATTLIANYAGITSYRVMFEEREKRKIRKTFAQYLSPDIIHLIEKDPKRYFHPGGETKDLSIMFSDIRSFTTISEGMTADELVALLNEYLGDMTDIVFQRWGTLDKYIGDAIMAFWGSPFPQADHASRACACALEMSARLEELNLKWQAEGRRTLAIGIGINSGPVSVGNMGSTRRLAWTVIGDNVNLASRLEGMTKEYRVRTVISENTYKQVGDEYVCRELDLIRVKGKLKPVGIYELVAFAKDGDRYADLLARFADARAAYEARRWDEAIQKFEDVLQRYPYDGPAHVFLRRSHEFRTRVPAPDWDGVYVMDHK